MSQRKTGAALSYLNIVIKNLVVLIYTPFLLRYLGQSDYGLYQMANSLIMTLSLLSMGMGVAYVRFHVKYQTEKSYNKINQLNGMFLTIFVILSLVCLIVGGFIAQYSDVIFSEGLNSVEIRTVKVLMILMTINISLTFISSVFDSNILVHEEFKFQQSRQIAQSVFVPLITVPLVLLGYGSISIVIGQTLVTTIFLILNARFSIVRLNMRFSFNNFDLNLFKDVLSFSFFVFMTQVVEIILNQGPSVILGMYDSSSSVATYSVALQLKNLFVMLSSTLSTVFLPYVNKLVAEKASGLTLTKLMIKVGRIQFILLSFFLGGFIVVGKEFIIIWAGENNQYSYVILLMMIAPALFPMAQNLGVAIQQSQNRHKFRSIAYFTCAVIDLLITILLVKGYGIRYVMIGFIVYTFLANIFLMNWYYQKKMSLDMKLYWNSIKNLLIPFTLATFSIFFFKSLVGTNGMIGIALYAVCYSFLYFIIYIFTSSSLEERELLFSIFRRVKN
ncbi:lipopolysaccharide biosynthesis protein [Enterococcus sp. AZ109]|uniref:lipopolysaccharide biosynthesis protein n=1 Tax=Enterococcus sp. AZ109 TaxID=2774634 RepID=UPI003F2449D6